jgi:hypothetical protein
VIVRPVVAGALRPVDGGWRPGSSDLEAVLPHLLWEVAQRGSQVERVIYRLDEWSHAPKQIRVGGDRVHLDGYHRQPRHTVSLLCSDGSRIVMLVVPTSVSGPAARAIMTNAGRAGNAETVQQLLGLTLTDMAPFTDPALAQQRWDTDGGPQDARRPATDLM